MNYISNNLVRYRAALGLTQHQVSEITGIKRELISRHEAGRGGPPTIPTLEKYARVYKCSVTDLVNDGTGATRIAEDSSIYIPNFLLQILKDTESLNFIKKCLSLSPKKLKILNELVDYLIE